MLHVALAKWVRPLAETEMRAAREALEQHGLQVQETRPVWAMHRDSGALRTSQALEVRDPQTGAVHQLRLDLVSSRRPGRRFSPAVHELRLTVQAESAVLAREPRPLSIPVATLTQPCAEPAPLHALQGSFRDARATASTHLVEALQP